MQTLGLSESTPRTESRLRSLFWPSVQSATDVDYLGAQGYWICSAVAGVSLVFLLATGHPLGAIVVFAFFFLGGVGVRERSCYAAAAVFALYTMDFFTSPPSILRILIAVILLSNVRATWIAAGWKPDSEEAVLPPRLSDTWGDRFTDKLPSWLWPKVRIFYYIFSVGLFVLIALGFAIVALRQGR